MLHKPPCRIQWKTHPMHQCFWRNLPGTAKCPSQLQAPALLQTRSLQASPLLRWSAVVQASLVKLQQVKTRLQSATI
jgi:hypothetical protein